MGDTIDDGADDQLGGEAQDASGAPDDAPGTEVDAHVVTGDDPTRGAAGAIEDQAGARGRQNARLLARTGVGAPLAAQLGWILIALGLLFRAGAKRRERLGA